MPFFATVAKTDLSDAKSRRTAVTNFSDRHSILPISSMINNSASVCSVSRTGIADFSKAETLTPYLLTFGEPLTLMWASMPSAPSRILKEKPVRLSF